MSDGDLLLLGILTDPADDTARLVYADWLEENGNAPWARFVRHQVWTPVEPCRNAPLTALLSLEPFVGPLPHQYSTNTSGSGGARVVYPNGMVFWFTRGFVSRLELSCDDFLTHAEALFRAHPITEVQLTDAIVFPNSGNRSFYLGGLGRFPQKHWSALDGLRSFSAVLDSTSAVCIAHGRDLAGLPTLTRPVEAGV